MFFFKQNYQSSTVSPVVGAPWRCGVLTTQGGIAGIGLGRLLGGEHASTPQSGVEAPRLLKRSLPRLYYCCCCCCCFQTLFHGCVCPHAGNLIGIPVPSHLGVNSRRLRHPWSPRALTGVSARKLEKLALNSGIAGGARKMTQKCVKKPIIAAISKVAGNVVPVCVAQLECPLSPAMNGI